MELIEFKKILSKALSIVKVGIEKGYFDSTKEQELNNKLLSLYNNGIVYDIPGTAIYGIYSSKEKKLYFNAKVFKTEEEALTYVLHEIKHGLDDQNNCIGFEINDEFVGINEGATQRFATDVAEEILHMKFPNEAKTSLGIQFESNLDEYQIEDKLNELLCITLGITKEEFFLIQNSSNKNNLNSIIERFNKHANFETIKYAIDEIYHLQEETWFDENGNLLEKEKSPTLNQTKRAMYLINHCKAEFLKYAEKENKEAVEIIERTSFIYINEYGEIISDNYSRITTKEEIMTDQQLISQKEYLKYQNDIENKIKIILGEDAKIVFVTEFRYDEDNTDKIVYYRKDGTYKKVIVPILNNKEVDINNIEVQEVYSLTEIKDAIEDCEAEFGIIANPIEYSKILELLGYIVKSKTILKKWDYYLSKENELNQIQERLNKEHIEFMHEFERLRHTPIEEIEQQENIFENSIFYKNIMICESGIIITKKDGSVESVSKEEEIKYITIVKEAIENGILTLTKEQLDILKLYDTEEQKKR